MGHLSFKEHLGLDSCSTVLFRFLLACAAASSGVVIILAKVLLPLVVVVRVLFVVLCTVMGLLGAAHRLKTGLGGAW